MLFLIGRLTTSFTSVDLSYVWSRYIGHRAFIRSVEVWSYKIFSYWLGDHVIFSFLQFLIHRYFKRSTHLCLTCQFDFISTQLEKQQSSYSVLAMINIKYYVLIMTQQEWIQEFPVGSVLTADATLAARTKISFDLGICSTLQYIILLGIGYALFSQMHRFCPNFAIYINWSCFTKVALRRRKMLGSILILWGKFWILSHFSAYFLPSSTPQLGLNPSWGCLNPPPPLRWIHPCDVTSTTSFYYCQHPLCSVLCTRPPVQLA